MKKIVSMFCTMLLVLSLAGIAGAMTYTFTPGDVGGPNDLWDLDHGYVYGWGIEWTIPTNETIVGASLFFDDIYNWQTEINDLWLHLVDDVPGAGTLQVDDPEDGQHNYFEKYFEGEGTELKHWQNLSSTPQDITYDFKEEGKLEALVSYITNENNFGLGFDPDCHFYNNGITLNIETATAVVPEPTTLFLVGVGLLGLAILGRKRIGKK